MKFCCLNSERRKFNYEKYWLKIRQFSYIKAQVALFPVLSMSYK